METISVKVPYFDFKTAPKEIREEWASSISGVLNKGQFIGGESVSTFEKAWAKYLDVEFVVGVGNGLDALTLSLKSLGIGRGCRVAVPSHTFIATWLAVESVGAIPVGIDVDASGLIDLEMLESLDTTLDAVIPVHLHGQMVDMERLCNWASPRGVKIIEDCAQAHGAKLKNKYAGTWGDLGAFSFYPTKNLGALGDAGAVVSNNPDLAQKIRSLGNYGSAPGDKYRYEQLGLNSRLDPVQASVLSVNLRYLDVWNTRRREIASHYLDVLKPVGAKFLKYNSNQSVWHHFVLLTSQRNQLKEHLFSQGIQTEIHYPQCASDSYAELLAYPPEAFIEGQRISSTTLSLPIHPWLTDDQIDHIATVLDSENSRILLI